MATGGGNYEPVRRRGHSTIRVGDNLYMWGGYQPGLPRVHDNEEKRSFTSRVEVFDINTGVWTQKQTTGRPPLGISSYSSVAVGNNIYYYGGFCGHDVCYHNSLYSLNVITLSWKEHSPTTTDSGHPSKKAYCDMIHVQFNGEDYLAVFGGECSSSNNTPHQPSARYNEGKTNEIHYFCMASDQWISPVVTGNIPPPCYDFTLTSLTNNTAIMFGGVTPDGETDTLYSVTFTLSSVNWKLLSSHQSVNSPKGRRGHRSVLINTPVGRPHLLVVGGVATRDCWLLDINKLIWTEITGLPETVTNRWYHSLSVYSVTPNTVWMIEFGGEENWSQVSDTSVIELTYILSTTALDYGQSLLGKWREFKIQLFQDKDQLIQPKEITLNSQLKAAVTKSQQAKATLEEQYEQLKTKLKEKEESTARLMKQNEETEAVLSEKDKVIQSLEDKLDEEKREKKITREKFVTELKEKEELINKLQLQLQRHSQENKVEIGVIPQFGRVVDDNISSTPPTTESFRGDIAHNVICTNIGQIKKSRIHLDTLADKLRSHRIISDKEKKEATDERTGLTVDERMNKLLDIVSDTIEIKGSTFKTFLDILKEENTIRTDELVDKLLEEYKNKQQLL